MNRIECNNNFPINIKVLKVRIILITTTNLIKKGKTKANFLKF